MEWLDQAGRIVDTIGAAEFPRMLARGLREIADYDFTVIFGYFGSASPVDLFDDFPPDRRRLHVEEYQEGPYLLDPFFLASLDLSEPGLWRIGEIAPDRFYQGEYYRNYYAQTGLAEEIGYLIRVKPELVLVVSMMRREKRFSNAEVRALKRIWPVVDAACRKNWQDLVLEEDRNSRSGMAARVEDAFRSIGEGILTPRERQVVELTLRGHSADAIGKLLDISSGTVRIHRRNIYSKLRISSQGELFSNFLNAMLVTAPSGQRNENGLPKAERQPAQNAG
ncbi:MAG: helix-turn-helix transcriptional regulator, partial [Pseudomonadota bacterium]